MNIVNCSAFTLICEGKLLGICKYVDFQQAESSKTNCEDRMNIRDWF